MLAKSTNALIVKFGKGKNSVMPVNSFSQASKACTDYISYEQYGASQWGNAGQIFDVTGKQIARVSYNGRVWDMEGKEIYSEIASKSYYANN